MTENIQIYFQLFLDNVLFSSILPLHQSWVFLVMHHFGLYNQNAMFFVALGGRIFGSIVNYTLGVLTQLSPKVTVRYNKNQILLVTIAVFLLCWVNALGAFLCFAAGYMRAKFLPILLGVTLSNGLYYLSVVMKF